MIVPNDVQELPYEEPPRAHGAVPSSAGYEPPVVVPRDVDLAARPRRSTRATRSRCSSARARRRATDEVIEVAELLGAGVAKALNGRAAVPDDLPFVTGSIGLLGTKPSDDMMQGADTLLMVGTGFPYAEWLPEPGRSAACRSTSTPARRAALPERGQPRGRRRRDAARADPAARAQGEPGVARGDRVGRRALVAPAPERAQVKADPINPQLVFHELSPRLPDRAIVLADSGSATNWWARHLRLRRGMDAALSGTLATMGPAVPYALAAKLAYPDRPVIACLGDGAMQMIGTNALVDLAKYRDRWRPPLVVIVLNNGDLNQVTWEQRVLAGEAKLEASQNLPAFDFAAFARQIGLEGIRVERSEDVAPALDRALAAGRPAVVDVLTDPRSRRCRRTSDGAREGPARGAACTATPSRRGSCASPCATRSRSS